jgi:hypothetical protein
MPFPRFLAPAVMVALAAPLTAPLAARADEYLDRVNEIYARVRAQDRSDTVLLPLVGKMDAPPASVNSLGKAILMPHGGSGWSAAQEWSQKPAQREVLEALAKVTRSQSMAFAQPYGADAVATGSEGIALVQAGLYTDLGDPPMLAAARFLYLPAVENVGILANVEATKLAAEGQVGEAVAVMTNWLWFSRQMADREMYQEARWGMRSMISALERIRDLAYRDFRSGSPKLTVEQITAALNRLKTDDGYLMGDRLVFPEGNYHAAMQAVAMTFHERDGTNASFGQTMARLATTQRPLRLFSEAARWDEAAETHSGWSATRGQIDRVYDDWRARWPLAPFDRLNSRIPDYQRTSPNSFALVTTVIPDMGVLFNDRQVLRTQLIGTRNSLAILAFWMQNKSFPPAITSVRPRYLQTIEPDPFNPDRAGYPLQYFVPIRDQAGADRPLGAGHTINVISPGAPNFQVTLRDDQFVLYSVGPNQIKEWARDVSGEPAQGAIGDLLLWPPVTSLLRQHLTESGQLR